MKHIDTFGIVEQQRLRRTCSTAQAQKMGAFLETIAPQKAEFQKDSIPRKVVIFLRKGPRFSVLRKGLDLHISFRRWVFLYSICAILRLNTNYRKKFYIHTSSEG